MGWGSGVYVFDSICEVLLGDEPFDKKKVLKKVIEALEHGDWDTHDDSAYIDDLLVQEVLKELHPHWFDGEDKGAG
jgi:hypothetical protein